MSDDLDLAALRQRLELLKQRIVDHVNAAESECRDVEAMMRGPLPKLEPVQPTRRRWPRLIGGQ